LNKNISLQQYEEFEKTRDRINDKTSSGLIVDKEFYKQKNYIYSYTEGLNTKNATIMGTGVYSSVIRPLDYDEIIAYRLEKPYYKISINFPLRIINQKNLFKVLLKYLVQFQQLNYKFNPKYDLGKVFDEAIIQIRANRGLGKDWQKWKDSLLKTARNHFEDSIKGTEELSLKESLHHFGILKARRYFAYSHGFDSGALILRAIKKEEKETNDALVNYVIDAMMENMDFVCLQTIKDALQNKVKRPVERVYKERKDEIKRYNLNTFGVKTLNKFKELVIA